MVHGLEKLLPFTSRFIEIDGFKMHYLDEGSGPVVVLMHGNPTWCFYYRNLIQVLKRHYRVIAPDQIGCGLSDHPTDSHFRARDRIEHLATFLDKLGIDRFSMVMHDWGGPIGTGVAVRRPDKIEKLVYLNTTLTETESLPFVIKTAAKPFIGKFLTKYSRRFLKLTTDVGVSRRLDKDVRRAYHQPYRSSKRRTAIWDFVEDIPFNDEHPTYREMLTIAEGLPNLQHVPVQIIWGLKDPCFHREMLSQVVKHFPQAQVLEIPDASHLVLEDAPELVCSTILDFFRRDPKEILGATKADNSATQDQPGVLISALSALVKTQPFSVAATVPRFYGNWVSYEHTTFAELESRIGKYHRGLVTLGLKSGDRVLMLVPPGADFLALAYAVMSAGAIPIFIDPGIDRKYLFECISDLKPDVFIGSTKAQLLRVFKRKYFTTLRFFVVASDFSLFKGPSLAQLKKYSSTPRLPRKCSKIAMIAFTSGATGKPKGVVFTQEMLSAQLTIFRESFKFEAGARDLPLLPIFSLFTVALGVGSVFPPISPSRPLDLNPADIVRIITDLNVQFSFGSPTLWKKISEYCLRTNTILAPLKRIFMAGAPVPLKTAQLVEKILGGGESFTPYGATEALPVTFISARDIISAQLIPAKSGEQGTLVGKPVAGVEVQIIEETSTPIDTISEAKLLEPLIIGEIVVKGLNVSSSYFERPDADRIAKISDGDRVWHRMGDVGYLDSQGNLYFCGRKAHSVVGNARIYYSEPVERVFNQHPRVGRSALIELAPKSPAIVIEPIPQYWPQSEEAKRKFSQELLEIGKSSPLTSEIEKVYFHPSFPVDRRHNAKIFRDLLSQWAKRESSGA